MKVALVHEFLTQLGGAERVLQAFHEMFPEAPVHTLVYDERKTEGKFKDFNIQTSFLQRLPGAVKHYKWYLPLMARAMERLDLSDYDLILSDSSAFAKGARGRRHICYCHTPTRYLWESMDEYVAATRYPGPIKLPAKFFLRYYLKDWDYRAAQRPDVMIANSRTVQERIRKYYGRDAEVIYPPVQTEFFRGDKGDRGDRGYHLTASRLEPYKRIDLVVEAFKQLRLPLKVAGDGTAGEELISKNQESGNIEFLGRVSDEKLRELYRNARAFVFPALEDAGIMVLEALACGTPVIGLAAGGTAEFVRDGENGVLFGRQSVEDIVAAVRRFEGMKFEGERLRESVLQYSKENFKNKILDIVDSSTSLSPSTSSGDISPRQGRRVQ